MRMIEWAPITWSNNIPPFRNELEKHLKMTKSGGESYTAWNLLYKVLQANHIELGIVAFTSSGKPFFPDNHVYFSLTQTVGLCAVSVSDVPTGIDVELTGRRVPIGVQKKLFSVEEYKAFKSNPVLGWCRKEVTAKMSGEGMLEVCNRFIIHESDYDYLEQYVSVDAKRYVISASFEKKKTENRRSLK